MNDAGEPITNKTIDINTDQYTITPGITLPGIDDLNIRLARIDYLEQLDQARSDYSVWLSLTLLAVGAALGILTNWITSQNSITQLSIVILTTLIILAIIFSIAVNKYKRREDQYRKKIMSSGITYRQLAGRRQQ